MAGSSVSVIGVAEDDSVRGKGKGKMKSRQEKKSIFSLGSDGEEEERRRSSGSDNDSSRNKEGRLSERQRRERSVSEGRSAGDEDQHPSTILDTSLRNESAIASDSDDGASSGSECATPTPASISRGRQQGQAKALDPAPASPSSTRAPLDDHDMSAFSLVAASVARESLSPEPAVESEVADGGEDRGDSSSTSSSIPGIAPRLRRGVRGPAAARRVRSGLAFDVDIHGFAGDIEVSGEI